MASLSWAVSTSQAQCPDTSYFWIKVTPANSGCYTLCGFNTFKVIIYYPTTPNPTIIRYQYFSPGTDDYYFCVQGPISMNICAIMQKVGSCKEPSTFTCGYMCTNFYYGFPAYASKYSQPTPLYFDYCLN